MRVDLISDTPWYYAEDERYYLGEAGDELHYDTKYTKSKARAKKRGTGRKPPTITSPSTKPQ
jgi:hypothetical protein